MEDRLKKVLRFVSCQLGIIFLMLWSAGAAYADTIPKARTLKKAFFRKVEYFGQYSWHTCNADSSYYQADTVQLYTEEYKYMNTHCCREISWTFHNKRAFQLTDHGHCQEPPLSTVHTENGYLKLTLKKRNDHLILSVKQKQKLLYSFRVLDFKITGMDGNGNKNYALTLLRISPK